MWEGITQGREDQGMEVAGGHLGGGYHIQLESHICFQVTHNSLKNSDINSLERKAFVPSGK